METKTKEKVVNFGRLSDVFNDAFNNKNDLKILKKWEEIFDEEFATSANTISSVVKYISAWNCYTPSSRRPVLLNRLIAEAKTPKDLHDCLVSVINWGKEEKEELEQFYWEVSGDFFKNNQPLLPGNLVVWANNIFYLTPPWQAKATTEVSRFITEETNDDQVKEYYLAITTPGDLSDEACLRFLKTAKNEEEVKNMITKLSLVNQEGPSEKIHLQRITGDKTRKEKIQILWSELRLSKFLKTKTLKQAKEIINDFAPKNGQTDILRNKRACFHLTRFINDYETGKNIYKMVVDVNGKGSLVTDLALEAWSIYLVNILQTTNPGIAAEELEELHKIVTGEMKDIIVGIYWKRILKEWRDNPL